MASAWSDGGLEKWHNATGVSFTGNEVENWPIVMSNRSESDAIKWLESQPWAKGRKVCRRCCGSGEADNPAFSCGHCEHGWAIEQKPAPPTISACGNFRWEWRQDGYTLERRLGSAWDTVASGYANLIGVQIHIHKLRWESSLAALCPEDREELQKFAEWLQHRRKKT